MQQRKTDIKLRIGSVALTLPATPDEEQLLREAAKGINQVWTSWRQRYTDRSSAEVMAMVTLLFAQGYLAMKSQNEQTALELTELERELDSLIAQSDDVLKAIGADPGTGLYTD